MEIRDATPDDGPRMKSIAERSLNTSYSLGPETIEGAVEQWYSTDAFDEKFADEGTILLVAETDDGIVGFSESVLVETGGQADLLWLHVDPDYRGESIGNRLFEATRDRLETEGAAYLRGRVLADNQVGADFYERMGFERIGEQEVTIDGDTHVEYVYLDETTEQLQSVTVDDEVVHVDTGEQEIGSRGPFYVVYSDPDRGSKYGYYCSVCESFATAMDTMGRIKCGECGNTRKATRWDASY